MSVNLKNPETDKLARSLARETGESLTEAVTTAIRERLESVRARRKKQTLLDELIAIGKRGALIDKGPYIDHADLLYDEKGLPK